MNPEESPSKLMIAYRYALYVAVAILVLCSVLYINAHFSVPTAEEIQPKLKEFIMKEGMHDCENGIFSSSDMSQVHIGPYDARLKAWPIYATYAASCQSEKRFFNRTATYDPENPSPVAFAQKRGLGYRLFEPKSAAEGREELKQHIQNIKDKVRSIF